MLDANNLLELIKQAATEAVEAGQACDYCYGTVTSGKPLKILVEQRMELTAAQLVLCRNVTDFKISASAGNVQDYYYDGAPPTGGGEPSTKPVEGTPHVHAVGELEFTVKNALKTGDKVVLLRKKGGQEYLVLDRVVKA